MLLSTRWQQRSMLVSVSAVLAMPGVARAQAQEICFDDSIPLTPTNWVNQQLTVSKFDPNLGILTGIEFTLEGTAEGSAGIESLDATPTTATTTFQAELTLQRPDLSTIVITLPAANFSDNLTAFDGIVDFGGTSGITHGGITTTDSETANSPPPDSDLVLFTGPAGNPGTISLPVEAIGASIATGGGNVISEFMTSAAAVLTVCYTYELDCNGNGIPDDEDVANGTSEDCNMNGIPDECEQNPGLQYCFGVTCPCGNTDPTAGCANSTGSGALLDGAGTTSITNDDLLLTGTNMIPNEPCTLFSADDALVNCLGRPFGDGIRCTGENLIRLQTVIVGATGDVTFGPGLIAQEDSPFPGQTRRYQIWYRDPTGPCASQFNLTNGYAVIYAP